jgi:hypothetical protein
MSVRKQEKEGAVTSDQIWTRAAAEATVDPNECGGPGTGPGTVCPEGNPNWGEPLTFQEPRTVRLGVRLTGRRLAGWGGLSGLDQTRRFRRGEP